MASREETRALWRERILAFRASGMPQKTFAREHGLCNSALRYWLKRIDEHGEVLATPKEQTRQTQPGEPQEMQWISLVASDDTALPSADVMPGGDEPNVRLHVAGITIEVRPGFDEQLLANVLRVVKSAC